MLLDELIDAAQCAQPAAPIGEVEESVRAWARTHTSGAKWAYGRDTIYWLIGQWGADNRFAFQGTEVRISKKRDAALSVWRGVTEVGAPWRDMYVRQVAEALDVCGL